MGIHGKWFKPFKKLIAILETILDAKTV